MQTRRTVRDCLMLLDRRDRRLLAFAAALQVATSAVDLLGVLMIGLVAALAVTVVQGTPVPPQVTSLTQALGWESLSPEALVGALALVAAVLLLVKSLVSSLLMRRVLIFLARRQFVVSTRLIRHLLSKPLIFIQRKSSQQLSYALIQGTSAATTTILGQSVVAVAEVSLLLVLGLALLIINPLMGALTAIFFVLVALGIQLALGRWAARVGRQSAEADIMSLNDIQAAIETYRELMVTGRREHYVERVGALRLQAAEASADLSFIGVFPKYMYEAALVVGGFSLAGLLFLTQGVEQAVGTLALFLAAGTRIMPSLIRLQTALLTMRNASPIAHTAIDLSSELDDPSRGASEGLRGHVSPIRVAGTPSTFVASIQLSDVTFTYPGRTEPAVRAASLNVAPGEFVALVGQSGAGKSTLVDLMLGVMDPDSGEVLLGAEPPSCAVARWQGAIGYVPQHVALVNGTVRENVALGLRANEVNDSDVWQALERAHLADFVTSRDLGLDLMVGERGVRLSGGQRQRLGIARALFSRPRLVVLDEATSSLDAETELAVTATLARLRHDITVVVNAHRLSTVREADKIVYLEQGRILAEGSFEYLRTSLPAFSRQVEALGL